MEQTNKKQQKEKKPNPFLDTIKELRSVYTETNRLNNKSWYKDSFEMDVQLHIFIGKGTGAISYIRKHKENKWEKGPNLDPNNAEGIEETLIPLIEQYIPKEKHAGLGVILYIADKFRTSRIDKTVTEKYENSEIRAYMMHEPRKVLTDSTTNIEDFSWRVIPVKSKEKMVAVGADKKTNKFLKSLVEFGEKVNIPIRTRAVSAPLCAISALPYIIKQQPQNHFVTLLMYPNFTVLSIFNSEGGIIDIQSLEHGVGQEKPAKVIQTLQINLSTHAIDNPTIFIIPMGSKADKEVQEEIEDLITEAAVYNINPTLSDFKIHTEPNKAMDMNKTDGKWDWKELSQFINIDTNNIEETCPQPVQKQGAEKQTQASLIPNVTRPWSLSDLTPESALQQIRLEIIGVAEPTLDEEKYPLYATPSIKQMINDAWCIQDFLPQNRAILYPKKNELLLYKLTKYIGIAGLSAATLFGGFNIYKTAQIKKTAEWTHVAANRDAKEKQYKDIIKEHAQVDNIVKDRSRMWSTMELPVLLTSGGNTILESASYDCRIDSYSNTKLQTGYTRKWSLTGFTNHKDIEYITQFNTEQGVKKFFNLLFKTTGDESFNLEEENRIIPSFVVRTKESNKYEPTSEEGISACEYAFSIEIEQTFLPEGKLGFIGQKKTKSKK